MQTYVMLVALELAILFCAFVVYIVPTLLALERQHHHRMPIIIINAFLGWTLIGWVLVFAWSVMPVREAKLPLHDTHKRWREGH